MLEAKLQFFKSVTVKDRSLPGGLGYFKTECLEKLFHLWNKDKRLATNSTGMYWGVILDIYKSPVHKTWKSQEKLFALSKPQNVLNMLNHKLLGCVHPLIATGSEFFTPDYLSVHDRHNQMRLAGKPERHLSHHRIMTICTSSA